MPIAPLSRMIFAALFCWSACTADVGPTCKHPEGKILADAEIQVIDDECDSDGVCGYVLRTSLISNGVPFVGFVLVLANEDGKDQLLTNLRFDTSKGDYAETFVFAHRKYLESLMVLAVYQRIGGCDVSSVFRPRLNDS